VDNCGTSNTCSFNVTVQLPTLSIICPSNVTVVVAANPSNYPSLFRTNPLPVGISRSGNNVTLTWSNSAPNPTGAAVNYTVAVSGGCPPTTTNCVPASGSTFQVGVTTVNCTNTDNNGQQATCSFTVTVNVSPWTYSIYRTNNMLRAWATNWPVIVSGYPAGGSTAQWLSYTDSTATAGTNFYRISVP
jgi:hypothetical protein